MEDNLNLVADLALILISAGIFTIISKALKQPLVLGYILAGLLVGPHVGLFPTITSTADVKEWSEIGIIFMMFALGLEFSFKKLLKVGASAFIIAACKFIGLFLVGFGAGLAMHWTTMESIFLGGLLSMSSTAVVIKAYGDMGLKDKPWASTVFGTLVIEDIIAIILMVVFSTVAVSKDFHGGALLLNLAKLAFFLILWFVIGIYLLPTLFRKAHKWINDEILLIVSVGLCFGMVTLADAVGFSSALGAFVMGSILAETIEGERILKITGSIKNLFSAIFFVSVGMMIDPVAIAHNWLPILVITLLVIIGHIVFAAAGALLAGRDLRTAIFTGFSLSQLGEFGFILAGVGTGLGVMRDFTYPVIVAVSVITTFTTPYMIKLAQPFENMLRSRLPESWLSRIDTDRDSDRNQDSPITAEWKEFLKRYTIRIVIYSVVLIAIVIGARSFLMPLADRLFPRRPMLGDILSAAVTLLVMTPLAFGMGSNSKAELKVARALVHEKESNRWPIISMIILKAAVAMSFVVVGMAVMIDNLSGWVIPVTIILYVSLYLFLRRTIRRYSINFEDRFMTNLSAGKD